MSPKWLCCYTQAEGVPLSSPFLRLKYSPSSASMPKQTQPLAAVNPPLLPTSPWSQDPSAWGCGAGSQLCNGMDAPGRSQCWKANPELPQVQMPLRVSPGMLPLPVAPRAQMLVTHWWLPGPLSCPAEHGHTGEHWCPLEMELWGDTESVLRSALDPRSTRGGFGDMCVPPAMSRGSGTCWLLLFFAPG